MSDLFGTHIVGFLILKCFQGADWHLIARHDPADYLKPKRLAYDIPSGARMKGVQFRWWQPVHGGEGHDQWAMDHVEIVP